MMKMKKTFKNNFLKKFKKKVIYMMEKMVEFGLNYQRLIKVIEDFN